MKASNVEIEYQPQNGETEITFTVQRGKVQMTIIVKDGQVLDIDSYGNGSSEEPTQASQDFVDAYSLEMAKKYAKVTSQEQAEKI